MFKSFKNNQGSMLMDIIVSLGIIVLLSTIALPYLKKYQPNLKLNGVARDLTTDLRYAQQLTVTEQKIHQVVFDLNNNQYQILKIDTATTTIKTVILDPEINIKEITGLTDNKVIFNYYGSVSSPGQIILSNINNLTATINIKPSGYIQLE
ncbi:MAG: GspH/FimT family protein [bacterium]|nr:GspH/FimT family protein [bacterium]